MELKITKKRIFFKRGTFGAAQIGKVEQLKYIFENGGGSFGAAQVEKVLSFGAAQANNGGFRAAHIRTALI